MRWIGHLLPVVVLLALSLPLLHAGDKTGDYLTKDGQLKERLEILELQGGFAGFTGTYWTVEPDGQWSTGQVLPRGKRGAAKAQGKLSAEQLAGLAKDLARHDLAHLANHGKPVTNPRVLEIRFGKKTSVLQPNRGEAPAKEDEAIRARYRGIAQAVQGLCKAAAKE